MGRTWIQQLRCQIANTVCRLFQMMSEVQDCGIYIKRLLCTVERSGDASFIFTYANNIENWLLALRD